VPTAFARKIDLLVRKKNDLGFMSKDPNIDVVASEI
jgi:hypothetical protein